jgi:hypothetical protein
LQIRLQPASSVDLASIGDSKTWPKIQNRNRKASGQQGRKQRVGIRATPSGEAKEKSAEEEDHSCDQAGCSKKLFIRSIHEPSDEEIGSVPILSRNGGSSFP